MIRFVQVLLSLRSSLPWFYVSPAPWRTTNGKSPSFLSQLRVVIVACGYETGPNAANYWLSLSADALSREDEKLEHCR